MAIAPNFLEQYIPGLTANTGAASANIGQQLTGLPSTGQAKRKAAYFGATSGMPNSGVSNALGYDLYGEQADQYQQQGFDNLLKMLTSYSGTAAPTTAQVQQEQQWNQDREDRRISDFRDRAAQEEASMSANRPRKYAFTMTGNRSPVPGGFQNREWWA